MIKKNQVFTVKNVTGKDSERIKIGDKLTYLSKKKNFGKTQITVKELEAPILVSNAYEDFE